MHLDPERMPVQAVALVIFRHIGQSMRGFDLKGFEDFHAISLIESRGFRGEKGTRSGGKLPTRVR
jgi:hypothetical protein